MEVRVKRKSLESFIEVVVDDKNRDPEIKKKIDTPLTFFNHMIEQLAWRSELNIAVKVELDHYFLNHVICEDVGITMGKALSALMDKKQKMGAPGYGFSYGNIDESLARTVVGFEKRAYLDLDFNEISVPESVEGINSEDLVSFLEGLAQGSQGTFHIELLKARANHGHHQWESIFRSLGDALRLAFKPREWRKNMTAGVAGEISYEVEER